LRGAGNFDPPRVIATISLVIAAFIAIGILAVLRFHPQVTSTTPA